MLILWLVCGMMSLVVCLIEKPKVGQQFDPKSGSVPDFISRWICSVFRNLSMLQLLR
jgi:hypothetical protein